MLAVATTKQMISLRLEHQKRIEENDQFKEYEPKVITYEYHTKIQGEKKKSVRTQSWELLYSLKF